MLLLGSVSVGASETYLTEENILTVRENWSDYNYAAKKFDVPVLVLVAIHYRESDLRKGWYSKKRQEVVRNIGGPFMLDFGPLGDHKEFARRIRAYEKRMHRKYGDGSSVVPKVSHDFRFAAWTAAQHLKNKDRFVMVKRDGTIDNEAIADAVWGYNGRASWHRDSKGNRTHEKSSYVWSDPKNGITLFMQYRKKDGTMKRFIDMRPGVMIIYSELIDIFKEKPCQS